RPSISPQEKWARASRICARRTAEAEAPGPTGSSSVGLLTVSGTIAAEAALGAVCRRAGRRLSGRDLGAAATGRARRSARRTVVILDKEPPFAGVFFKKDAGRGSAPPRRRAAWAPRRRS